MTRSRLIWPLLVVVLVAALAWVPSPAGAAGAKQVTPRVPQGFAGMVVDEPVWPDPWIDLQKQLDGMAAAGVESLRVVFNWSSAQPYRSWNDVPDDQKSMFENAGGMPTDFAAFDQLVAAASRDGLKVLPVVLAAPNWDGETRKGAIVSIPKTPGPYAAFVKALVKRYGPGGSFWQTYQYRTKVPVKSWQIWNEPNIYPFWPVQPFETRYVALLAASRKAIKSVDPTAKVVLAGMPNYSWINLQRIYKVRGARDQFDMVAIHPYTKEPQGVITILGYVRKVMNQNGDTAKPILADEISWPSSVGKTNHNTGYDFASTESGQAQKIKQVLPMLVANRKKLGIGGFYYYDWAGLERHNALAFEFAGLFKVGDGKFAAKPAYNAFRQRALAMEDCRSKGQNATSCGS
jgi:hypothetical protein